MEITRTKKAVDVAEAGTWLPFGDGAVRVAQWMNKNQKEYIRGVVAEHGRKAINGALGDEKSRELLAGQWPFVLTGFEGFTEEGKKVEWSPELVAKWAMNVEYEDFFKAIKEQADDALNFRKENILTLGEILRPTQSGQNDGPLALSN
jgi:hypothetical protein